MKYLLIVFFERERQKMRDEKNTKRIFFLWINFADKILVRIIRKPFSKK